MTTIYFDMDGTIAGFYNVQGWLDDLIASNPRPYAVAKPLFDFVKFSAMVNEMQSRGYRFGIVSWLSKSGTPEFNKVVTETKREWLANLLPEIEWDEIHIVTYGTPKSTVVLDHNGYLFDDEERNRIEWGQRSFDVQNILETLATL